VSLKLSIRKGEISMAKRKTMTLEELLTKTPDGILLDIELELLDAVVPTDSKTQEFRRKVNKMIDRGELCINPNTYRKVYLPTLAKAVQKEMARRYTQALINGVAEPDKVSEYTQITLDQFIAEVSQRSLA